MEGLNGNQAVTIRLACPIDGPEDTSPHLVHDPIRAERTGRHRLIRVLKCQESASTWIHRLTRKCMFFQYYRAYQATRFMLKPPRERKCPRGAGSP